VEKVMECLFVKMEPQSWMTPTKSKIIWWMPFLFILQDPKPRDGQKNGTCWDQICKHCTIKLGLSFCLERPTQSLETKCVWSNTTLPSLLGIFKSCLGVVQALYESITIPTDTLWKGLDLYMLKQAKGLCVMSFHTWLILQVVFCWANLHGEAKKTWSMRRKTCIIVLQANTNEVWMNWRLWPC
jgi:hypothetical protein